MVIICSGSLTSYNEVSIDLTVFYSQDQERFYVMAQTGCGYFIERGSLVSQDHKYESIIIDDILKDCSDSQNISVYIVDSAMKEINRIGMANCDLF